MLDEAKTQIKLSQVWSKSSRPPLIVKGGVKTKLCKVKLSKNKLKLN